MTCILRISIAALTIFMIFTAGDLTIAAVFIKPIKPFKPPPKSSTVRPHSKSLTSPASAWPGYSIEGLQKSPIIAKEVEITAGKNGSLRMKVKSKEDSITEHTIPSANLPAGLKAWALGESRVQVVDKTGKRIADTIVCNEAGCNSKHKEADIENQHAPHPHAPHPHHTAEKHDSSCEGEEPTPEKCGRH